MYGQARKDPRVRGWIVPGGRVLFVGSNRTRVSCERGSKLGQHRLVAATSPTLFWIPRWRSHLAMRRPDLATASTYAPGTPLPSVLGGGGIPGLDLGQACGGRGGVLDLSQTLSGKGGGRQSSGASQAKGRPGPAGYSSTKTAFTSEYVLFCY